MLFQVVFASLILSCWLPRGCDGQGLIVCPPNYCDTVRCERIDEAQCNGLVKPNASFCGCCPRCIRQLGIGDSCIGSIIRGGAPPTSECGEGLICGKDAVCVSRSGN